MSTPEQERKRSEVRRTTPAYLEYQREYQRRWRAANAAKVKEAMAKTESRPERKEYKRIWLQNKRAQGSQ